MEPVQIDPATFLLKQIQSEALSKTYRPVQHHWFYNKKTTNKSDIWQPFSLRDSRLLEEKYETDDLDDPKIVATDGGRFDVDINKRLKIPVYWKGEPSEVRRCSWFYKGATTTKFFPFPEEISHDLEKEYKECYEKNQWPKKIEMPDKDNIVIHSSDVIVLLPPTVSPDDWNNAQAQVRPRVIQRGVDDFDIDGGEPDKVDHVLFMVHGIGSVCDLKFRTVQEVVDDFRNISLQLIRAHYQSSFADGRANRVEVLPISWHDELHSDDTGIDKILKSITLDSISKLRDFANDTILDVLFYTSPKYCQKIISIVGDELNRLFELFKKRNPSFQGQVSLGGHSLGSLILFDLLAHQNHATKNDNVCENGNDKKIDRRISHMYGEAGSGITRIHYPQLLFQPTALFAMGSPIGMFVTVRGLDSLGEDFALPTCGAFFNIFHPYDPVAYRIESLINPKLSSLKPMLIPHHKGRKRMHLELKETMARVGADLKQKVIDSVKHTWNTLFQLGVIPTHANPMEEENGTVQNECKDRTEKNNPGCIVEAAESLGILNKGRRIDYVLQESPFEIFNEYVSAIMSHVCYWESEDTMLFILKEIYSSVDVHPDSQIPQATMTIERPPDSRRGSAVSAQSSQMNDKT